jgi:hypothetical protein
MKNCEIAFAYAARVFRLRIVAAKNSTKRQAAASPARPINRSGQVFQTGSREIPPWDWDELGTHGRVAFKPRRRKPNSSKSKKSAGSISSSVKISGSRCPSFEPVSDERGRFLALFFLPELMPHNVLYDTSWPTAVKRQLAEKRGLVKEACPQGALAMIL